MAEVTFTVPGVPAPQGSKTRTKWGVREDNPATRPWRSAIAWEATAAMQGLDILTGPVEVLVHFVFPRPKSHFGTGTRGEVLKESAPKLHTSPPDADKLERAIGDSLRGIVLRDDAQIAHWDVWKLYGQPHAEIVVRELG